MELTNFSIDGQSIGLEWPDGCADLHNDFDFIRMEYQLQPRLRLALEWGKSPGAWAKQVPYQVLRLIFEGVTYLNIKERDPDYPISEDDCLRDICRTPIEERADFDNVWVYNHPPSAHDLQLVFQSEWGIKVNADTVHLELEHVPAFARPG